MRLLINKLSKSTPPIVRLFCSNVIYYSRWAVHGIAPRRRDQSTNSNVVEEEPGNLDDISQQKPVVKL
jgi:hypothetical protein